jgi:hypothetical protein
MTSSLSTQQIGQSANYLFLGFVFALQEILNESTMRVGVICDCRGRLLEKIEQR